jgi:hypothetical protein
VWSDAVDDAYAVGAGGTILHYSAGTWTAETAPGVTADLHAVYGTGPTDVWAAGGGPFDYAGAVLLHRDAGGAWTIVDTGVEATLHAIAIYGTEMWIGGAGGSILHK